MEVRSKGSSKAITVVHSGDQGDLVAALPIVRTIGPAHFIITERKGASRESMLGKRFEAIKPLLEHQEYILSVHWRNNPKKFDYDFSFFQRTGHAYGKSLTGWQSDHVGKIPYTYDKWLSVFPSKIAKGRVIISRSQRYHNGSFPWDRVLRLYENAIFVGHEVEHHDFQRTHGVKLDYIPTGNLLELAELIAGAKLFIGNQSCPMWIAFGLNIPVIQETWGQGLNSIIPRDNCVYTRNYDEIQKLVELLGGPKVSKSAPQPMMIMP